ncbi:MAG: hypothetical protein CAK90_05470, partial [Spartobacteria bacterium AMD-G4]
QRFASGDIESPLRGACITPLHSHTAGGPAKIARRGRGAILFPKHGKRSRQAAVDIWGKIEAENGWLFDCIRSDSMQDCIAAIADELMEILVGHPPIND